ncbi:MAG: glycosyl hydrolase family 65 protein [Coriobacteriia bacterium]
MTTADARRWTLVYEGYDPDDEGLRESLCTLGNGFFATRGAGPESSADDVHYPGTYVACLYNRLTTHIAGRDVVNEDLVNVPNWLPLTFSLDGNTWFSLDEWEVLEYRQTLDMLRGTLLREAKVRHQGKTVAYSERRLVHMAHRHLAAVEVTVTPLDFDAELTFRCALDGLVENKGVPRYRDLASKHLVPVEQGEVTPGCIRLTVETSQSHIRIAEAARITVKLDGETLDVQRDTHSQPGYVDQVFTVPAGKGQRVCVEKVVSLFTSRDRAITDATEEACEHVMRARGFNHLLAYHELTWKHLWDRFRIEVEGDVEVSRTMHLHVFHLLQTVSHHAIDQDIGVPARGWHGEAYRGHIFWDELFIFPFLNLHQPEIVRSLLQYRYRRLTEARYAAYLAGRAGAMFPWQSGSNGREETQTVHLNPRSGEWLPDNSHRQRHISSAVAYNVWQYYQATGDLEFMSFYGTEMLLEIARFWASMAEYVEEEDRYVIRGVMGPDEYHEGYPWDEEPRGIDNNAYTNVMAVWVLLRALDALEVLPLYRRLELTETLGVTREEIEKWEHVSRRMKVCFHDGDIISQFEGYERLEEFDWDGYRAKYGDIHRLDRILTAEGDSPNRYKLSKQADVLMLMYVFSFEELAGLFERLGYRLTEEMVERNIDYYLARTSHGSTLSGVVASWVLARSRPEESWQLFKEALRSDVNDVQGGTTREGIHLGAMAGTVDIVQRCYTGIEMREDVLHMDPFLPPGLERLNLNIRYRGQWLDVEIGCDRMVVRAEASEKAPIRLAVRDEVFDVVPGDEFRFDIDSC